MLAILFSVCSCHTSLSKLYYATATIATTTTHTCVSYFFPLHHFPLITLHLISSFSTVQGFKKKAFEKTAGLIASLPSMVMSPSRSNTSSTRSQGRRSGFGLSGKFVSQCNHSHFHVCVCNSLRTPSEGY